jgi:cytoskeletal protein CcmA (bactofilin family)
MSAVESGAASIGKSVEIRGEVKGGEDLIVEGRVEGTITLTESRLTVGASARVDADVSARDVVILGTLNGNVYASVRVELRKGGNLTGDIHAARLSIEEGSIFTGKVDLTQTAASGKSPVAVPAQSAAPASTGGLFTPTPSA